jgi:hypothetical protein
MDLKYDLRKRFGDACTILDLYSSGCNTKLGYSISNTSNSVFTKSSPIDNPERSSSPTAPSKNPYPSFVDCKSGSDGRNTTEARQESASDLSIPISLLSRRRIFPIPKPPKHEHLQSLSVTSRLKVIRRCSTRDYFTKILRVTQEKLTSVN